MSNASVFDCASIPSEHPSPSVSATTLFVPKIVSQLSGKPSESMSPLLCAQDNSPITPVNFPVELKLYKNNTPIISKTNATLRFDFSIFGLDIINVGF